MSDLHYDIDEIRSQLDYLQLLSKSYKSAAETATEIINLEAILNLPKGTEHFLADIHGEHEAFLHVLRNASGDIKRKISDLLGDELNDKELRDLCTLIYYPSEKLQLLREEASERGEELTNDWYRLTLRRLVIICRNISSKYTRSKVRKALPKEFSYIIQELLHESDGMTNKNRYVNCIIDTIIDIDETEHFIVAICSVIQRLAVDRLHIVGDVFDRGAGSHLVMDALCEYQNFDIQFGNHDILWIGAASGNKACMANLLRICMRYGNLGVLEDGYGINLLPLATFAMEVYKEDPCADFGPRLDEGITLSEKTRRLIAQMHKAVTILQFKLEAEIIRRRPEFNMDDRLLFDKIDFKKGTCFIDGRKYSMTDTFMPTVNPQNPYSLSIEEEELMEQLVHSFMTSEKLHRHIQALLDNGSMYLVSNGNLMYHASVPMNEDGSFRDVMIDGEAFHGRSLLKRVDEIIREAYEVGYKRQESGFAKSRLSALPASRLNNSSESYAVDFLWYLWCGKDSPLFDKDKMATFERSFLKNKSTQKEKKGAYYTFRNEPETVDRILDEFEVKGHHRHIINGHTPVHTAKGESPMKAGGKLLVIDGGFSKPYHRETGIAGYTLVYHSRGMQLVEHQPFLGTEEAIRQGTDIRSTRHLVEMRSHRLLIRDTDKGREIEARIDHLRRLLFAYREGLIK
ncbi:MAG: fructose-1,6-bisphosphatase [Bacteroidaceae bacterium]|nr:fructose-1,6-bisphosphatase [Bacteroidaceae bacterium]